MADLAPRDVVARTIDASLRRSGDGWVLLDITHRDARFLERRFPNIHRQCLEVGIDMTREPIPVAPATHYFCGGVRTDLDGETDLPGLFAAGEVACTGLHGANRLASNSLLEALVFADAAARQTRLRLAASPAPEPSTAIAARTAGESGTDHIADAEIRSGHVDAVGDVVSRLRDEIRSLMWSDVGIVRTDRGLARARQGMNELQAEVAKAYHDLALTRELVELNDIATVAGLVIECAMRRKESRGLHHNTDHPERDDAEYAGDTRIRRAGR